jgi:hypothetical protein
MALARFEQFVACCSIAVVPTVKSKARNVTYWLRSAQRTVSNGTVLLLIRRDDGNDESANETIRMKMTKMTMTMTTGGSNRSGFCSFVDNAGRAKQRTKGESFRILC